MPKPTVRIPESIVTDRRDVKYRNALTTNRLQGQACKQVVEGAEGGGEELLKDSRGGGERFGDGFVVGDDLLVVGD